MKDSKFTTSRPLNQSVKPSWMNCYPAQSKDQFSKELILLMRTLPSYHVESAHWTHICHWRVRITYPKAQGRSKRQQIQRSSWKVWGWQWVHPAQHSWTGKCSQLQAEPAGTLRLFNIKKLLSQQQSSKIASLSFLNASTEFIAPLVQKSDRSYEDPAPNTQQQPPTHAHAPATPDYKEPKPSTPRQGSPSPEMLSTAANTASTLPSCVCSPVLSLCQLTSPQGCKWEKDSSKLSSSASFDGGGKLPTYHPTSAVSCLTCCLLWLSCYSDPGHLSLTPLAT